MKPHKYPIRSRFLAALVAASLLVGLGCVEEVDIRTDARAVAEVQNALVVEATLTDELRTQEVILSRPADFENDSIIKFDERDPSTGLYGIQDPNIRPILYVSGASVSVEDDNGGNFAFTEGSPGRYFSNQPFAAQTGREYRLRITLPDGTEIRSGFERLAGTASLTGLRAERSTDPLLGTGVRFTVDGDTEPNDPAYLRYTFEETFKVIAPLWTPEDFLLTFYDPCADPVEYAIEIVARTREEQVCYRTEASKTIIQATTEGLAGGQIRNLPVHFLPQEEYKIAHRYSILVRQHVEDLNAYLYYDRLRNFSQEGNVFAQVQPGDLQGNMQAENTAGVKVIGYFSVASVSERRIFLNYEDLFPGEPEPPYIVSCRVVSSLTSHPSRCPVVPNPDSGGGCPLSVIELLDLGDLIRYVGIVNEFNGSEFPDIEAVCPGEYLYTSRVCGDCTVLGSNVPPDFWTED